MSAKKQTTMDSFIKGKRKPKDVEEQPTPTKKTKAAAPKKNSASKPKESEDKNIEETKEVPAAMKSKGEMNPNPLNSYEDFVAHLGDWQEPLKDYLKTSHFKDLYEYVKKEYDSTLCFPPKELIFNAFQKASFDNILPF